MESDASRVGSGSGRDPTVSTPGVPRPGHPRGSGFIPIIHAGARFAVVDKPAGMLSVPGKGPEKADCAASRIAAMFPAATGPLVVHRLDMETSGLLVFGLDEDAQRDLSGQFEQRLVQKTYTALLPRWASGRGDLPESGTVDLPMRADIENRPVQIIDHAHGRESVTNWQILSREIDRVRIRFDPLTGRTHQLRLHAAAGLERPIIGDVLYGGEPADRLMLHAATLSFLEPGTKRRVSFESPSPF
jgi:tRNA pseudouridine32 synthase / 23S rRNA pseudouridine746 synthase